VIIPPTWFKDLTLFGVSPPEVEAILENARQKLALILRAVGSV
jgi:hypothetical protein